MCEFLCGDAAIARSPQADEIRDQLDECMQLLRFSDQSAERVDLLAQLIDHCRTIPRLAEYTERRTLLRTYVIWRRGGRLVIQPCGGGN